MVICIIHISAHYKYYNGRHTKKVEVCFYCIATSLCNFNSLHDNRVLSHSFYLYGFSDSICFLEMVNYILRREEEIKYFLFDACLLHTNCNSKILQPINWFC